MKAVWGFFLAGCAGALALAVCARFSAHWVWDDAYLYVRYADHLREYGALAWDPAGAPTYGLTAPLNLVLVAPLRAAGLPSALALQLSSLACALAFLVLLTRLLHTAAAGVPGLFRGALAAAGFALAAAGDAVSRHVTGGMDTALALAHLTAYLLLVKRHEGTGSAKSALAAGAWGGLAVVARPELLLYAVLVPASLAVHAQGGRRRRALVMLGLTLAVTAGWMGFATWYFQSPLPLPFYVKSVHGYGPYIHAQYAFVGWRELGRFLGAYWPFVFLLAASAAQDPRAFWRGLPAGDKGVLFATSGFLLYHAFLVLPVMFYFQRFSYPTLPAVLYLAAGEAARLAERHPQLVAAATRRLSPRVALVAAAFGLGALLPAAWTDLVAWRSARAQGTSAEFDVAADYRRHLQGVWFRLDRFSALPDSLVLATTELGVPGVLNPHKAIVDLAGLNDTALAHGHTTAAALLATRRPDLIYMPHSEYAEMHLEILGAPWFRRDYEHFGASQLGTSLGLALRRDSPHYAEMRRIMAEPPSPAR